MIDEILNGYGMYLTKGWPNKRTLSKKQALTAIYEIGLGVIGEDVDEYSWNDGRTTGTTKSQQVITENKLKASQRLAWAKACGVAEK